MSGWSGDRGGAQATASAPGGAAPVHWIAREYTLAHAGAHGYLHSMAAAINHAFRPGDWTMMRSDHDWVAEVWRDLGKHVVYPDQLPDETRKEMRPVLQANPDAWIVRRPDGLLTVLCEPQVGVPIPSGGTPDRYQAVLDLAATELSREDGPVDGAYCHSHALERMP